jgi:hypothetical protein
MAFQFPSDDALLLTLSSGLVSAAVAGAVVRSGRGADGRRWIQPAQSPPTLSAALRRLGVEEAPAPDGGCEAPNWLQAVPLRPVAAPPAVTERTPVLFELTDPSGLGPLVAEMLRLGNDRQGVRLIDAARGAETSALLRVVGPPFYSLLRALEPLEPSDPLAYLEQAPRVWVRAGWTHPLVKKLRPPAGQVLLLRPPAEWTAIADRPFRDVYEVLDLRLPDGAVTWTAGPPAEPLAVPLRLAPTAPTGLAGLWVLRGDAVEQIDALVRDADDRLLAHLAFAVGESGGERVVVLRARPGRNESPAPALDDALICWPYLRLPNLYLPLGTRLRPPLRREATRRLLADDPDRVVWLAPRPDGSFVPHSLPESAFRPLRDWVEYILTRDEVALSAWSAASRFDFESFVGRDASSALRRPSTAKRPETAVAPPPRKTPPKPAAPPLPPAPPADAFVAGPPAQPGELQAKLKQAEEQFLSVDGPLDDPRRVALWPRLGRLNGLLGQTADASLAWANALWETAGPPPAWAWAWVEGEQALEKPVLTAADLGRMLAASRPAATDLRPLAAVLTWAGPSRQPELQRRLQEVQHYLERHDHLLPVRSAWLAWVALTDSQPSADVLALARARDRLLERLLAEGLVAERDLPGFLRYAGRPEGDRMRTVRSAAERLRQLVGDWFRQTTSIKGRYDRTPAYIDLFFAFGTARLGEATAARGLLAQAAAEIEAVGTEAHTFLLQALHYRIEQALADRPHAGPLPPEQREYLDQMRHEEKAIPIDDTARRSASYAVERLGRESAILQPEEKLDPYRRIKLEQDAAVRELVRLTDVHDRSRLAAGLRRLAEQAAGRPPEVRLRVLAEALPLAARVGEAGTSELLIQVGPALDAAAASNDRAVAENGALLLERALFFAAHYDLPDLVRKFAGRLGDALRRPAAVDAVGPLVAQTFRSLRKLGLKDHIERLLGQIEDAALAGRSLDQAHAAVGRREWQQTLRLLLPVAGGWFDVDRATRARPILDAARGWILKAEKKSNDPDRPAAQYVALVNAYIAAVGRAPLDEAIGRIEELFTSGRLDRLPNTLTSNHYYSLLHLIVAEAVVLTVATEDFAVGLAARRWLDDDEFLVRRRIHRDVRAALARAGM